jgi:hypothetical protein
MLNIICWLCFLVVHLVLHLYRSSITLYFFSSKSVFKFATSLVAVFERVTKNSVRGIWSRRSKLNLVGAHINVFTGEWTQKVYFCLLCFKAIDSIFSLTTHDFLAFVDPGSIL